MKFIVIEKYGSRIVEAEDISEAVEQAYNNHYGFDHILGIVSIPEDEQ